MFEVIDHERENSRTFDSRLEAEEAIETVIELGTDPNDVEMREVATDDAQEPVVQEETLPDDPSVAEDPVSWMPEHFVDKIQGVPTVNRKGFAVIASKYGVSVTSEPVTLPSETDFKYAEFKAVATTEDGREYSGFGSAHVDRQDGDDPHLLAELAETRAMKRATSWATGVGMTAVEELKHEL